MTKRKIKALYSMKLWNIQNSDIKHLKMGRREMQTSVEEKVTSQGGCS